MDIRDRRRLALLMPITCDRTWEVLEGEGDRRHCRQCDQTVVRIEDENGLRRAMTAGSCINVRGDRAMPPMTGAAPRDYPPPRDFPASQAETAAPAGPHGLILLAVPLGVCLFMFALMLAIGR